MASSTSSGFRAMVVVAVVAAVFPTVGALAAQPEPPNGREMAEACGGSPVQEVPEIGPRACRSALQLSRASGMVCRHLPAASEEMCQHLDGRDLDESLVDRYEDSWVHRALTLQRALDADTPLRLALVPGTHNSFNSAAYEPTLSGLDHNQQFSLVDQLRMDMRGIEVDVHWVPSASGDPAHGLHGVIVCHGQPESAGPVTVHVGCTTERPLVDVLAEIKGWLDDHPAAVILLYLENNLDGDPAAHDAAAAAIDQELGGRVYRDDLLGPTGEACAPMPTDLSRDDLRAAGAQVLIVGNCGPGAWGSWVHERDQAHGTWKEDSLGADESYDCSADRDRTDYASTFVRYFEDSTWLSAMAGSTTTISVDDTKAMVRCGVNLFGFDQLRPDDPRLAALVWSWAPGEPSNDAGSRCAAVEGRPGRFHARPCDADTLHGHGGERHAFACRTPDGWTIAEAGFWAQGSRACADIGAKFSVPATGADAARLDAARDAAGADVVWTDYARTDGTWTPGASRSSA